MPALQLIRSGTLRVELAFAIGVKAMSTYREVAAFTALTVLAGRVHALATITLAPRVSVLTAWLIPMA